MMNKILQIVVLSVVFATMSSFGTPQLDWTENWANGLGTGGDWNSTDTSPIFDNGGYSLKLTLPDQPAYSSKIWASSSTLPDGSSGGKFTGSYSGISGLNSVDNLTVEFKIKTVNDYNNERGNLGMYFVGNSHTYYYKYDPRLTQPEAGTGYKTIDLVIGNASYWNNSDGGDFNLDFTLVTEFGFSFIGGPQTVAGREIYLTDLKLFESIPVPEPETVWMMVMVLVSLGLTFRGRLADLGNQVKARLVA